MSEFDIIIRNGTLIDGTGAERRSALDIGIRADRIEAIGDLAQAQGACDIDADGSIVAPGFVDVHNHTDGWLLKTPNLVAKTAQGFTTEVIMADGISYAPVDPSTRAEWIYYLRPLNALRFQDDRGWSELSEYMELVDGASAQNAIAHIPYANVRAMHSGWGRQVPDDYQMGAIKRDIARMMDQGAVGLSTGIDYISQCFASTDELVEASAAMSPTRGLYVTHVRYKKSTLEGVREAVEIGRRADVPVHISHLKGTSPREIDEILSYIDDTARQQVDFSFDVYPYLPGSTTLNFLLPYDVWEQGPLAVLGRLHNPQVRRAFARSLADNDLSHIHIAWLPSLENEEHIGKLLSEYVDEVGGEPEDVLSDLLIEENLAVLLVFHHGEDELVHPFLQHDCYMMGSDGIYFPPPHSRVHPRVYGSAPRLLGPCVRDTELFSLEQAVRKLSGYPAERFGLEDRGILREGTFADVVIFDATTVCDRATFEEPHQLPEGISTVLVNGIPVIQDGTAVQDLPEPRPGRALKRRGRC
ncbi:MAG: D-aminoacylase [Candidatus Latescibacterota bacterium]|nr:D-aminoacylase [Candidatus Latescibacterota bacterium]